MDPTDLINYQNAIKSIESSGGNYGLSGPVTRNGDRAYGAYQVMGNNIPEWTQKHFGQALTPKQFLANKEAQDAVFNGEFGSYVQKHGNPQDAASMWFTGRPLAQGGNSDDGYITGNQYVDKFNKALGGPGGANPLAGIQAINSSAGIKPQQGGRPALAFSGDDDDGETTTPANATPTSGGALTPGAGALAFPGEGSGKKDNRFGLGDLFGASDETKEKMHGIGARLVRAAAAASAGVNPAQAAQFNALGKSLEEQNKTDYQYMLGPNGQIVKINKDTGAVNFATLPGGGKGTYHPVIVKGEYKGRINVGANTFEPAAGGVVAQDGPQIGGDPNLSGQERYDSMSPADQREVTAMLEGRGQPLTSMTLRNPEVRMRYEAARAVDPSFDTSKYAARQKTVGGLAQSTPGSLGGQLDSSAAMTKHVTDLADDYIKLHNSGGYGATLWNAGKNATSAAGSERDQLLKSIATHSMNFSGEVTKQLSGAPGGQEERQRRVDLINQPNGAPATQAAALEAELSDAINKRQATLDRVKDTMGEQYIANNPRFKQQEADLERAKSKLLELRNGPAIKDAAKPGANTEPAINHDAIDAELKRRGLK